ncbi:hypothetical protein PG987_014725 [Apiospora arundinis]
MESYFTSAPAEVRLLIYSHLFTHPNDTAIEIRTAGENRLPPTPTRIRSRYHVLEKQAMLQRRGSYETTYYYHQPHSPLPFHQQQRYLPAAVLKKPAGGNEGGRPSSSSSSSSSSSGSSSKGSNARCGSDDDYYICAALMRVCRLVHAETSHLVYAKHAFDFGADMESVEPFLSDLTPGSRSMVREISLYKRGPIAGYGFDSDRNEWRAVCRYLAKLLPLSSNYSSSSSTSSSGSDVDGKSQLQKQQQQQVEVQQDQHEGIRKLRLVVQCGTPPASYSAASRADVLRNMTAAQFQLLADIKHESLDWVAELAQVGGIEELEVVPHIVPCPTPKNTGMILFAALSSSVPGLEEFLRTQLRLVD